MFQPLLILRLYVLLRPCSMLPPLYISLFRPFSRPFSVYLCLCGPCLFPPLSLPFPPLCLCASVSPVPSFLLASSPLVALHLRASTVIPRPRPRMSTRFTLIARGHARRSIGCVWRVWMATSGLRIPVSQQTFRPRASHHTARCVIAVWADRSRGAHTYAGNPACGGCPRASHDRARGRCPPPPRGVHALHTTIDVDIRATPHGAAHRPAGLLHTSPLA